MRISYKRYRLRKLETLSETEFSALRQTVVNRQRIRTNYNYEVVTTMARIAGTVFFGYLGWKWIDEAQGGASALLGLGLVLVALSLVLSVISFITFAVHRWIYWFRLRRLAAQHADYRAFINHAVRRRLLWSSADLQRRRNERERDFDRHMRDYSDDRIRAIIDDATIFAAARARARGELDSRTHASIRTRSSDR